MFETPRLKLPLLAAEQAQKHVTHNEAVDALDALVQLSVKDRDLVVAPSAPATGDRYIVASGGTGTWAGHGGQVASWQSGAWRFHAPQLGWRAWVEDEAGLFVFDGDAWTAVPSGGGGSELQNLTRLGLGTSADATNPFSAVLNNALWAAKSAAQGGDGDLRYKMSKEGAADTISLLLQTGFSGRAEIGLVGDDDLSFKLSADGATWRTGLVLDRATCGTRFLINEVDVASAASIDLGVAAGLLVRITGAATITSFGAAANSLRLIRFAAALTLTQNPVSLILPGGADILTAAGDTALATSDADGNWRVRHYQRADGTALVGGGGGGVNARELLTAARTYYVSTSGSDANDGRSPGAPFATLQKAIDTVASLDLGVHNATIELAAGAYTAGAALKTFTGAGKCIILGDEATPTNVDIQVTGGNCFSSEPVRGTYALRGMRLRTTTSGHCIFVQGNGLTVELQNVNFGASAGQHINVRSGAQVLQTGNYSISGGATVHWNAVAGGKIEAQGFTIALTGTPAFSSAFALAQIASTILSGGGAAFSGSATGPRYSSVGASVIYVGGGGTAYLPGNSAHATPTANGGVYY